MADLEDVTLDGRPLQSLRVADLKAALEERGLSKSGQKNALIKRLKGALMLENLQRTSTAHIGLQPNSQIGEEMSQNSFIKQYLAKQQELLRQRLEREAREAYDTNEQEDHTEMNNSISCPPQAQDDQYKPPGPSGGDTMSDGMNEGMSNRNQDIDMSGPPASGSLTMRVADHRLERGPASSEAAGDSDDEDSEDAEEDGDDDDWEGSIQRRIPREPARGPVARERSGASCQPQQQHIPSLLSPQLRQPTPPPSPPPELSFPLPDTPKQSPPSPDVAPARRSPSSSSSGSSSSGSRSSSPEPHSGHADRKPGPLTLLALKMESEGAFSGAGWHGRDCDRQDNNSASAVTVPGRGPPENLASAISRTTNTTGHTPFPMNLGTNQSVTGAHSAHVQVPVSVVKAVAKEDRDREREAELEREKALELEKQRKVEQERALEAERERALALEREERQRALEGERFEQEQALEREKALQRERELTLERERLERQQVLAKEREEREKALELERQKELDRQRALEREREEREERERVLELERRKALERERALEQEKVEREKALEAERKKKERVEREKALEQELLERERLERERIERERALEQERIEREKALELDRMERERVLEQQRLELERKEKERLEIEKALEQERIEREEALEREREEQERMEQERKERERFEKERQEKERQERLVKERLEKEKLEKERLEKERLEKERLEKERLEKERLEKERLVKEKLEKERLEKERLEKERLEKERLEKERLEKERLEKEKLEKEKLEKEKLEKERLEKEKLEKEKLEKEKLEKERLEKERLEKERLEKERLEKERLEKERLEKERLEKERLEKEKQRLLDLERQKSLETERLEKERALEEEKTRMAEKERESHLPPSKRGREIGLNTVPTPPSLSTGTSRKTSTDAEEQDGCVVHAPVSRSETHAAEATSPMSPQSSFKKFRFFRDSPLLPQSSSTSMVIKRPRTFSDNPHPQVPSVSSPTNTEGQPPEGNTGQGEDMKQKSGTGLQSEKGTTVHTKDKMEGKEKEDSDKTEEAAMVFPKRSAEVDEGRGLLDRVDAQQRQGRDTEKEEKPAKRRSSSDSSSSESDSGSSSSRSSDSSSSQEKTNATSRDRREEKPERDSSPLHRITVKAQGSKESQKTSPCKREMSAVADGLSHTKEQLGEAPSRDRTQQKRMDSKEEEEKQDKQRQLKEPAMAEPEKLPETNEETPKAFSTRKISLSSCKSSPTAGSVEAEPELGSTAGRKRRWGSSTAVIAKKPSISITTDSLKSLIPDIRPCLGQEAVVDLHPEETVLSGAEDEDRERSDQDLQIRRTVTQVVHSESQENGQKEAKRSRREELEEDDLRGDGEKTRPHEEKIDTSYPAAVETPSPSHTSHAIEINTVTPSDTLIRRSISQQKTGVSITIDDPVRTARQPSPPRGKVSNIVHICNLVRPFTLGQLKELLGRTGTLLEDGFWIDKIKSHCYVTYSSSEEAVATRVALHGVKWPQSNPKVLSVEFCQQDELDFHKGLGSADRPGADDQGRGRTSGLPSLLPERDQWAEREREMERRERARAEREWDRDKVRDFGKPGEEREGGPRRSRSRERRRKERGKSKEKKSEKKEKTAEDLPAKLLDDLFRKTKAAPCIYWLPLTEEQFVQRESARAERRKERERWRKEQEEKEEGKKREEERKERIKVGGSTAGDRSEGEKDKDRDRGRDRDRDRENDKRRDGYRRPGGTGTGGGRRSRSRSDPRERRR